MTEELSPLFLTPGSLPKEFRDSETLKLAGALVDADKELEISEKDRETRKKHMDCHISNENLSEVRKRKRVSIGELEVFMAFWSGTDTKRRKEETT